MSLNGKTGFSLNTKHIVVITFTALLISSGTIYFLQKSTEAAKTTNDTVEQKLTITEIPAEEPVIMTLPATEAERLIFVETLRNHLKERPDEVSGWIILARQLKLLNETEETIAAYKQANQLTQYNDIEILAESAESMVVINQGIIPHEALEMFNMIVSKNPDHPQANYFLGLQKVQDGNPTAGLAHWQAQLDAAPEGAKYAPLLKKRIEMLKERLGERPQSAP